MNKLVENVFFKAGSIIVLTLIIFMVFELIADETATTRGTSPETSRGFPLQYSTSGSTDFPPYVEIASTNNILLFLNILIAFIISKLIFFGIKKAVKK